MIGTHCSECGAIKTIGSAGEIRTMSDSKIKIVFEKMPEVFEASVNDLLKNGLWRVAETEVSVCDHHYFALLIKETPQRKAVDW